MVYLKQYRVVGLFCLLIILIVSTNTLAARKISASKQPKDQLPAPVLATIGSAVNGVQVTDVKVRTRKTDAKYRIKGIAQGKNYEWEIDASGTILKSGKANKSLRRNDRAFKKNKEVEIPYVGPALQIGRITHASVRESSGVVASRKHPGVIWTHNDKGNAPIIYAIDQEGKVLAEFSVTTTTLGDWEDIATDGVGNLYLGNIGNNQARHDHLEVYRLTEPDPSMMSGSLTVKIDRTWRLRFPDKPFDCESLFIRGGHGYVISKLFNGSCAAIYRFPLDGPQEVTLEKVIELPVRAPVTAADLSIDEKELAVLAGAKLYKFAISWNLSTPDIKNPTVFPLPAKKLEGVCFINNDILITAESREVYLLKP
jgi:hypothetical protein